MVGLFLAFFVLLRTTPAMATDKVAATETIPMLIGENTCSDDRAVRARARQGSPRAGPATVVVSTAVGAGCVGPGNAEVGGTGAGDDAARAVVEGVNQNVGCRTADARGGVGVDDVGAGDIGVGDDGRSTAGTRVANLEVVSSGAVGFSAGVGPGVRVFAPVCNLGVGEGMAEEPMSSMIAAKSYPPTGLSVQDPTVLPAKSIAPLYPAAMAIALSTSASADPPCCKRRQIRQGIIERGTRRRPCGWRSRQCLGGIDSTIVNHLPAPKLIPVCVELDCSKVEAVVKRVTPQPVSPPSQNE